MSTTEADHIRKSIYINTSIYFIFQEYNNKFGFMKQDATPEVSAIPFSLWISSGTAVYKPCDEREVCTLII